MQITYEQYRRQVGQSPEPRPRGRRRSKKSAPLSRSEVRLLTQLAISLALFLAVFAGKGIFPGQAGQLQMLLQKTADFKSAFAQLGSAISAGEPVTEAVGDWCIAVFSPGGVVRVTTTRPWEQSISLKRELEFLSSGEKTAQELLSHRLMEDWETVSSASVLAPEPITFEGAVSRAGEQAEEIVQTEESSGGEDKIIKAAYIGPELPDNATMDYIPLGLDQTITPVMGVLSSGYGYREHPVDGEYKFHAGADLAANTGTDIQAFADGVVEFIGASDIYGNYIQLQHAGGVTSFYAHCDEVLLPKGTQVSAGDIIARVGETGNATGPHLHLEIKVNGTLVDPMDYIETAG